MKILKSHLQEWNSINDYADAKSDCIAKILEYAVKNLKKNRRFFYA